MRGWALGLVWVGVMAVGGAQTEGGGWMLGPRS